MNFTQITADLSRPFAGSESWNGEADVTGVPKPLDIFYRMKWGEFQGYTAQKGQYDFTAFDAHMNEAISKGCKLNFSIMALCDFCGPFSQWNGYNSGLPKYIQDGMKGQNLTNGYAYQNFNDPFYLSEWLAINKAVYNHCVAKNWIKYIGYIDCAGYGNSGEWTTNNGVIGTPAEPTDASKMKIIDATVDSFPDTQCNALIAMFDGNVQLSNTRNSPAIGYYALTKKNNKGLLGCKRESWGESNSQAWWNDRWSTGNTCVYNGMDFGSEIRTRYKQAPVVGELMNFVDGTHYNDLDSQITAAHSNSLGNGNMESNQGDQACQQNARNAYTKMGAKWTLISGAVAGNLLSLGFSNKGLCPVYENFVIKYYLKQAGIIKFSVATKDLRLIPSDFSDSADFSSAPAGTYDLYVSIEDPSGVRQPYPLAIQGRLIDGSYLLQSGIVLNGGGPPVPPDPTKDVNIFTTQVPTVNVDNDNNGGAEMGVRFKSTVAGYIKGVRFYKKAGMTGIHVGELYDNLGVRLASANFSSESASGWQTVLFPTPVAILGNTLYTAAVYFPDGNKLEQNNYFMSDVVNQNLTAPSEASINGNAPQVNGPSPLFPSGYWKAGNYWIDVIFNTSGGITPPNQPPIVIITGPTDLILSAGTIVLDGSGSTDDSKIASYLWNQISGPGGATIGSPSAAKTIITNMLPGTFVFSLKVTDDAGLSTTKNYTTTVHF